MRSLGWVILCWLLSAGGAVWSALATFAFIIGLGMPHGPSQSEQFWTGGLVLIPSYLVTAGLAVTGFVVLRRRKRGQESSSEGS